MTKTHKILRLYFMKKTITILILSFIFSSMIAQNYRCIKTDAISHFQDSYGYFASIRIDSVVQNNGNTDYISYYMIRPFTNTYDNFYNLKGASWIGEKFRVNQNGDNVFYNALHESINIKYPIIINSQWEMYKSMTNNIIVSANVSQINYSSFLGLNDSIAAITLTVRDTNGQVIQNVINNFTLQLSKNYGLVTIFNFYKFPFVNQIGDDWLYPIGDTLQLKGLNNPIVGWQNITANDVFDWQIGWEFHTLQEYSPFGPIGGSNGTTRKEIRKILSKFVSFDTLKYIIGRCYYRNTFNNSGIVSEFSDRDTIEESYRLNMYINLNSLPLEPNNQNSSPTFYLKDSISIKEQSWIFTNSQNDTCSALIYDGYTYYSWSNSLGISYDEDGFNGDQGKLDFVYYKKGNKVWGIPYACNTLLNDDINTKTENDIGIFPNPNNGSFIVQINNTSKKTILLDLVEISGKSVLKLSTQENNYNIKINELKSGIYFLKIQTENTIVIKKVIIE